MPVWLLSQGCFQFWRQLGETFYGVALCDDDITTYTFQVAWGIWNLGRRGQLRVQHCGMRLLVDFILNLTFSIGQGPSVFSWIILCALKLHILSVHLFLWHASDCSGMHGSYCPAASPHRSHKCRDSASSWTSLVPAGALVLKFD